MIEARELTKRYGDTTAVHSLSLTIAPGSVTGFLGPNGAGKSTTMAMVDDPPGALDLDERAWLQESYRRMSAGLFDVGIPDRALPGRPDPGTDGTWVFLAHLGGIASRRGGSRRCADHPALATPVPLSRHRTRAHRTFLWHEDRTVSTPRASRLRANTHHRER